MVGAGIFALPATAYRLTGVYSLVALLVCGLIATCVILCFAEVSSRFSETGGPYLYAREAAGPSAGFALGWLMWLTRITAFATVCNLLITYLAHFWPSAASSAWRAILITTIVVSLTALNLVGVRQVALVGNILTVAKLVPLFVFAAAGIFFVTPENFSVGKPPDFGSFSTAVMLLAFAFSGFESATVNAGEARNPQRDFPYALLVSMGTVVVLYLLIQIVCIGTLPGLAASQRPLADAVQRFAGSAGGAIIVLGAIVSMAGTLNAALLACTRLPFAMASDGCLPGILGATHPRYRTPHISIVVSAAITLAVTLTYNFMSALALNMITRLVLYATTCACVYILRRKMPKPPGFTVPGGMFIPVLSLVLCGWLLLQSTWRDVRDVMIAAAVGLLIYVVYRFGVRRARL